MLTGASMAQSTQTIREQVTDDVSKTPLVGVNIVILDQGVGKYNGYGWAFPDHQRSCR